MTLDTNVYMHRHILKQSDQGCYISYFFKDKKVIASRKGKILWTDSVPHLFGNVLLYKEVLHREVKSKFF